MVAKPDVPESADGSWDDVIDVLKIAADVARLRILDLLEGGEQTVGAISRRLGIKQARTSGKLRDLRRMKLVVDRRVGTAGYYTLTTAGCVLVHYARHVRSALRVP